MVGLSACSTKPLDVNYYVLSPPKPVEHIKHKDDVRQVKLNKIMLADYLRQSSIAMQVAENQMYFSRQDVWAESLETAILSALLRDLNQNTTIQYSSYQSPDTHTDNISLTIHIESFHASDKSKVVSSGRYWLFDPIKPKKLEKPFYFSLTLEQDGYSHAISQQRQLLSLLAKDIQLELDQWNVTTSQH
ncbi:PqiC family protein [Paraglaciecola hydrolytica]|uniref:ABC-type transport auxiliary lipoprotein component domain-containing protein n=1 Tax=Paraglaciecola hydrolytica TaxID=1799789 RepID=A0A148KMS5_9ALTE|nr:hypothetical protein AX660_18820 [Paraglaciecola hydrolytica]